MTESDDAGLLGRLPAVAVAVAMQTHPGLDEAITVAEDLVAAGRGGPATVEVASLARASIRSDAEPLVRAMLSEFGISVPPAHDEAGRYQLLLRMFGHMDLPFDDFEGPFYARLTAWDKQDELDRSLVQLLHERDQVSSPAEREVIEREMRALVGAAVPAT